MSGGWLILRTAGPSTLPLARSLDEDGYGVWTPVRTELIKVPRANVKRTVKFPILAAFVFVRAHHLLDMLDLERMPVKPRRQASQGERFTKPAHCTFRIFRDFDRTIPIIPDRDLDDLRLEETKVAAKTGSVRFDRGARVRAHQGAYAGLRGRVERSKSGETFVVFDGNRKAWKVATWLLKEDEAISAPSGPSAKAA